jgi:hypothetical protein
MAWKVVKIKLGGLCDLARVLTVINQAAIQTSRLS